MDNYLKKCRICLSIDSSGNFISIFDKSEIALEIFLCTQIKIVECCTERLPALICMKCLDELTIAANFRNKAHRSDDYLRNHLKFNELEVLNSLYQKDLDIKLENTDDIKTEPTFELIESIETILSRNRYSTFENVNIRSYEDTENVHKESICAVRRKRSRGKTVETDEITHELNTLITTNPIRIIKESSYECKYCIKTFKHETYLRRHVTRVHSANLKVKSNSKIVKNDSSRKSCTSHGQDENTLFCEICQQFFTTRGSLQKHMKVKHEYVDIKDRYVCDYCGDHFVIKYYLIRHIRVRHLKTHVEKRVTDSPIPCEVCGKILKNRGLLKPHMRSHQIMTPNDYWYCDLCPRKFKTRGGCKWHIQQRHILKATFKCPYENCPVVYKGKWELKCHIKSKHTNQRDFRCEICGKGFLDKQKLQIHTRIHTGERPHACHLCTATFIHQTDLRRHIWGHTGERPLKCEVPNCGKGFMKKSELVNHTNRCHAPPVINFNTQYAL